MQNSRLPVEVCERVIDFCVGHPGTLYSCSLTCRSWVPRTRVWLFEIRYIENRDDLTRLAESLKTQPENGTFLHTLVIVGGDGRDTSWLNTLPTQMGPLFPNLRELRFTDVSFLDVHPTFMNIIATTFRTVTILYLRSARFTTFNQSARFLLSFHNLLDLTIINLSWKNRGRHSPTIGQARRVQKMALSSLTLRQNDNPQSPQNFSSILHFILATSSVSTLKNVALRLPGDPKDAEETAQTVDIFLAACGASIENLTVDYGHIIEYDHAVPVNLCRNDHLCSLTLTSGSLDVHVGYLSTISSTCIDTISLRTPYGLGFPSDSSLTALDDASTRPVFNHLSNIYIDIPFNDIKQLPKLRARGILSTQSVMKSSGAVQSNVEEVHDSDENVSEDSEDYNVDGS